MSVIKGTVVCKIGTHCIDDYVIQSFNESLFRHIRRIGSEKLKAPVTGLSSPKYLGIRISDTPNETISVLSFDIWIDDMDYEYDAHEIIQKALKSLYIDHGMGFNKEIDAYPPFIRHMTIVSAMYGFDYYIEWSE